MSKIFVIDGNQRSGTNMILHCLDGHSQLRVLPEDLPVYSHIYRPKNKAILDAINKPDNYKEIIREFYSGGYFGHYIKEYIKEKRIRPPKGTLGKEYVFDFSIKNFLRNFRGILKERIGLCGNLPLDLLSFLVEACHNLPLILRDF